MPLLFWLVCSLCCCPSRCLRSVSDQQPCCLCLQCLQWSTSTFLQSALASSIPCSFASLCALEVRQKTSVLFTILTPLCFYCIFTISHPDLIEISAKLNSYYYSVCVVTYKIKVCFSAFMCLLCLHLLLHFSLSHSDVQFHSAWPKERSHLEHNHVDIPLPGSGSHYLSVLPGVVCPALLPPERGNSFALGSLVKCCLPL